MGLAVTGHSWITVIETMTGEYVSPGDPTVTTDQMNTLLELTASTTPPVTKHTAFQLTMSGGAGSIDLTSLPGLNGEAGAVTFSGLKVQMAKFRNLSTNANNITIVEGASNGHPLLGAAFSIILAPGQSVTFFNETADSGTDVAGGDKTWDVSGTGSQILEVQLVAG